jgi:hypothetical protein
MALRVENIDDLAQAILDGYDGEREMADIERLASELIATKVALRTISETVHRFHLLIRDPRADQAAQPSGLPPGEEPSK